MRPAISFNQLCPNQLQLALIYLIFRLVTRHPRPAPLQAYIATGEPFDKAGSYGIQGLAGSFVEGIEGCYFNVMGFPVHRFTRELVALIKEGYIPLSSMPLK